VTPLIFLALGWAAWGGLHSLLISPLWMRLVSDRFAWLCPWYRLGYNALAVLTILPLLYFKSALAGETLLEWGGVLAVPRFALLGAAVWLFWAGARQYDLSVVGGLAQLRSSCSFAGSPYASELRTSGILGRVRHPWYGGALLVLWTRTGAFDAAELVTSLVLTGYVLVGTWLEERKLVHVHGDTYRNYQRRTPMFFPWPDRRDGRR
jgi:protein-S-isoprenylcysteine O-methyltransferase Ste14